MKIPQYNPGTVPGVVRGPRKGYGSPVGEAIQRVGAEVQRVEEAFKQAEQAAELMNNVNSATAELNQLQLDQEAMALPDRKGFAESIKQVRIKHMSDISDRTVAGAFGQQYDKLAIYKTHNINQLYQRKFTEQQQANLSDTLINLRHAAANAKTDRGEYGLITNMGRMAIEGMRDTGIIGPKKAVALRQKFAGDLQVDVVRAEIMADPDGAIEILTDPKAVPDIPESIRLTLLDRAQNQKEAEEREKVRLAEKQEKKLEKVKKGLMAEADNEAWYRTITRDLPSTELNTLFRNREITLSAYKGMEAYNRAAIEQIDNDPLVVGDIMEAIELGRDVTETLNAAMSDPGGPKIKDETYIAVRRFAANKDFQDGAGYVARALKPSLMEKWNQDKNVKYADAYQLYIDKVVAGVDPDEASQQVVERYTGDLRRTFNGLPAPMYLPVGTSKRDITALQQAELETVRNAMTGKITQKTYIAEMKLVSELRELAENIERSTPSEEIKKRAKKAIKK